MLVLLKTRLRSIFVQNEEQVNIECEMLNETEPSDFYNSLGIINIVQQNLVMMGHYAASKEET
jgi:hypothetical protein